MDQVLNAYKKLAKAVASVVYDSASDYVADSQLDEVYDALDKLAALYGMDLGLAATAFKEHNDLAAHADKLRGDDLVLIRVVGTLSIGLAEIGSCIYDVDQSLRTLEVIGDSSAPCWCCLNWRLKYVVRITRNLCSFDSPSDSLGGTVLSRR